MYSSERVKRFMDFELGIRRGSGSYEDSENQVEKYRSFYNDMQERNSHGYHLTVWDKADILVRHFPERFGAGGKQQIYSDPEAEEKRLRIPITDINRIYSSIIRYSENVLSGHKKSRKR